MREGIIWLIGGYLLIINGIGFVLMGLDKRRARKGTWRIREKTLFLTAAAGGSIGSLCGMKGLNNKTKHKGFVIGIPAILVMQCAAAGAVYWLAGR